MAIEWGFLILLAVGSAVADLSVPLIILVMAIGWILVVLVELVAWRARPGYAVTETVEAAPAEFVETPPGAEMPPLQPPIPPPSYDFEFTPPGEAPTTEDTAVSAEQAAPAAEETDRPALDPDDPYAPAPERELIREADQRVVHMLEPLKPRPRRRWFRKEES
jgi:hypothetical protein